MLMFGCHERFLLPRLARCAQASSRHAHVAQDSARLLTLPTHRRCLVEDAARLTACFCYPHLLQMSLNFSMKSRSDPVLSPPQKRANSSISRHHKNPQWNESRGRASNVSRTKCSSVGRQLNPSEIGYTISAFNTIQYVAVRSRLPGLRNIHQSLSNSAHSQWAMFIWCFNASWVAPGLSSSILPDVWTLQTQWLFTDPWPVTRKLVSTLDFQSTLSQKEKRGGKCVSM